jgi:hypothetical protein
MRSSAAKSIDRANIMINIVAKVVHEATGVSPDELRSNSCSHRVTKARFIFVDLCTGVVSPISLIADYLCKNNSMLSYYKRSHNDYYDIYRDFREMSDKADELLTELLTTINGNTGNVFQEEE